MTNPAGTAKRGEMVTESLRALQLMRAGRWLIDDLAEELGMTRRTAYRMLDALERTGIRIERQREGKFVYHRVTRAELMRVFGL